MTWDYPFLGLLAFTVDLTEPLEPTFVLPFCLPNELVQMKGIEILTLLMAIGALTLLSACNNPRGGPVYTLYRSSSGGAREHVATFDAAKPAGYNRVNCETARKLFASEPGVTARFWCERGRFQP